jgi:hypothetical protein
MGVGCSLTTWIVAILPFYNEIDGSGFWHDEDVVAVNLAPLPLSGIQYYLFLLGVGASRKIVETVTSEFPNKSIT